MLGVKAIRRWLLHKIRLAKLRRNGYRPEEEVFERFAERFGPAAVRAEKPGKPQGGTRGESPEETNGETQQKRPRESPSPPGAPAPAASAALGILGLEAGATQGEISAAYKRMARTYHPDKVAGEDQEVRRYAEEMMKRINAAYSELKLMGSEAS